jgi:hypothetical protein
MLWPIEGPEMSVPITVYFFSIASADIKTSMLRFTEVYFVAK